jgi:hypothetical protein
MKTPGTKQRSRRLAALWIAVFAAPLAHADRVQIESAVVESATGATSAISRSTGGVDTFFTLQKKMVYDTLVGIGISIDSLPPDVRARLAQFETRNFEAFRAFCVGLNAQDEGRFADAKAAFKRAVELDPSFGMAKSKESAMPVSDAVTSLQMQAVLRDAVKNATQAGKDSVAVDVAHAIAAMQSGMTVLVGQAPAVPQVQTLSSTDSVSNPPGSGDKFGSRSAVGISYTINTSTGSPVGVASTTDWSASQVSVLNNQLVSVGSQANFVARIGGATQSADLAQTGSATLSDGTKVYWGAWNSVPGASASVTESGALRSAPQLGPTLNYMFGSSTPSMPSSGTATLLPVGGNFGSASGSILADFGARQVTLNNLGFILGNYGFSGLSGQANYASTGSGYFSGNYSSGTCIGCTGFSPASSAFTGNFVGKAANGLIFSSIMQTGNGTVSGVHLFAH